MTPRWDASKLTFNAASHVYTYNGVRVPSATQCIELAGITKKYGGDPWYGERGTAVHLGCHLLDEGMLDWATVDPQIEPFVRCYEVLPERKDWKILLSEKPAANPEMGYACTPDRIVETPLGTKLVIDIKTGAKSRATGIQTALQAMCFKNWNDSADPLWLLSDCPDRYALHLSKDAPAELVPYADPTDYDAARGAVDVARWRLAKMRKWPSGEQGEDALIE